MLLHFPVTVLIDVKREVKGLDTGLMINMCIVVRLGRQPSNKWRPKLV